MAVSGQRSDRVFYENPFSNQQRGRDVEQNRHCYKVLPIADC